MSTAPQTTADPYTEETFAAEWGQAAGNLSRHYVKVAASLYAAWQSGKVNTDEWSLLLAALLTEAAGLGAGTGAGLAARMLHLAHGRELLGSPPGLLDVDAAHARLLKAADTLTAGIDTADDPRPRIDRLAKGEPLSAMQHGALTVYRQHDVIGYRRGVHPDACELCHWLKKTQLDPAGYVYPAGQSMYQHPGCTCWPIPVTRS
jgi:hypothetical protein